MTAPIVAAIEERNTAVIRRYLRVFETRDIAKLDELVHTDVVAHGAGMTVTGRHWVEGSVLMPGVSACRVRIDDLFAARDRVTVSFTLTYTRERTGEELTVTGTKCYRLRGGRIVEFWGETDLYGLLRQAGLVPERVPTL
jgi:ketosteroid isomerase-like protein